MTQCVLSPVDNDSLNPSCESFTLKHYRGFDLNASMKEVPEIYMHACDLLPVVMHTDYWS